jgi:hypothetical protein
MRFREEELTFKISDTFEDVKMDKVGSYKYSQVILVLVSCSKRMEISNSPSSQDPSDLPKLRYCLEKTEPARPPS